MGKALALKNDKRTKEDCSKSKLKVKKGAKGMPSPSSIIKKKQKVFKKAKFIASNSKKIINKRHFLDSDDDDEEEKLPELIENEASDNEEEENMEVDGTESVSENDEERDDVDLIESNNEEEEEEVEEEAPNDTPKSDGKKEKSSKPKSNIVHDEPEAIDKIDRIDLTRKKQALIFDQNAWVIADDVKTGNINFNKWLQTHSARDNYFFGEDEVREKMTKKLGFLTPIIYVIFYPLVYLP